MATCDSIGASRKQRVFAAAETTQGTFTFPSASDYVVPAGDATMNQVPAFVNSEEKTDSLDVIDQFQNARPPGDWSVSMYIRLDSTLGDDPQGDVFFTSLMGEKIDPGDITFALTAGIDDSVTTLTYKTLDGGVLPPKGVVTIGSEAIYYGGVTVATTTTGSLTSLTRGYNGTTAASHLADASGAISSITYIPSSDACDTFTLWLEDDFMVRGLSGSTCATGTVGVTNEGAVTMTMSGQGMLMVWAGTGAMNTTASSGASTIVVKNHKLFSENVWIYNKTKGDTNSTSGYKVTDIARDTPTTGLGTLTLNATIGEDWEANDVIAGYLPDVDVIGTAVESRYTQVNYDDTVSGTIDFQSTDLTIGFPKTYLTDIIGQTYSDQFVLDERSISSSLSLYFKKDDVEFFYDGFEGNTVPLEFLFNGNNTSSTARKLSIYGAKAQMTTPTVTPSAPTISLDVTSTFLGTNGDDSLYIAVL